MTALPKWLKKQANDQRQMRLRQRRVTSDEARKQFVRVQHESASRSVLVGQSSSLCLSGHE
jgi:hypothetical protein